jgi:hypothetical protein
MRSLPYRLSQTDLRGSFASYALNILDDLLYGVVCVLHGIGSVSDPALPVSVRSMTVR